MLVNDIIIPVEKRISHSNRPTITLILWAERRTFDEYALSTRWNYNILLPYIGRKPDSFGTNYIKIDSAFCVLMFTVIRSIPVQCQCLIDSYLHIIQNVYVHWNMQVSRFGFRYFHSIVELIMKIGWIPCP